MHEQVAPAASAEPRNPFAGESEDRTRLSSGRDTQFRFPAIEERHNRLETERRLGKAHPKRVM